MGINIYNYKNIIAQGNAFDSINHFRYYKYLEKLKGEGRILSFEIKPTYEVISSFNRNGREYEATTYTADFIIYHTDGTKEVVEINRNSTKQQELKRKLFQIRFPGINFRYI